MSGNPSTDSENPEDPREAQAPPPGEKWQRLVSSSPLKAPPVPVGPGNVPTGGDLRLDIGWERFEKLLVGICSSPLALEGIRYRLYGTPGQAQHGIDLAGRHSDGHYTVVQCKHVAVLTPAMLRDAVSRFADGHRPFNASRFIVAVSHATRATQLEDELGELQNEHPDLTLGLWGSEQINDVLRGRHDIVTRFWSRETADTFCTSLPPPGVAAHEPQWRRLAEQVSLTPLGEPGTDVRLRQATKLEHTDPGAAAELYGELSQTVADEGFTGHGLMLRRRQLTALSAAGRHLAAASLAAELAVQALYTADFHNAHVFTHELDEMLREVAPGSGDHAKIEQHTKLIRAAVNVVEHPFGDTGPLLQVLTTGIRGPASRATESYESVLTLMLLEMTLSDTCCSQFLPQLAHSVSTTRRPLPPQHSTRS